MQFPFELLLLPSIVIFLTTLFIAFEVTRSVTFAFVAAIIKSGVYMLYFGVFFDSTFTFSDDWNYIDLAGEMHDSNLGITDLKNGLDEMQSISGGEHFGYSLYNVYAFQFFGFGYYAPVGLNIVLTLFVAWAGANLSATEFGFDGIWRKVFFAFLAFHPDIFAWSNIMNGKDTLVLLLHILLLYSASMYFRGQTLFAMTLAVFVSLLLSTLRFYVPMIFAIAFSLSLLLAPGGNSSKALKISIAAFIVLFIFFTDYFNLRFNLESLKENFVNPLYGFFRFILTPIPFHTELEYSFLNIPALIHWLLMPFVMMGFIAVSRNLSEFKVFFICYVLLFLALYSCYGELQGPRHRVQIDYAWAVLQFTGIKPYLHKKT